MKALSLTQPWATLIALGAKRIETRSWSTPYRGRIAIHASKKFPRDCVDLCAEWPFEEVLQSHRGVLAEGLPLGAIVAVATLTGIARTEEIAQMSQGLLQYEIAFGDYAPGRFGWVFADVVRLPKPIPAKGSLGLWEIPPQILEQIEKEAA